MKIGIIVAMSKEFNQIQELLQNKQEKQIGNYNYVIGNLQNKQIILQLSGIGKVNAAIGTENLINAFQPDIIISTGVAGGANNCLEVMDVVASSCVTYHDVYCGQNNEYGQIQDLPARFNTPQDILNKIKSLSTPTTIHQGLIVTGDWFVDTTEKMKEILNHFPEALAVDMESCAIAQTCYLHNIAFCSFRIISDIPLKEGNAKQYNDFWLEMANNSFEVTKHFLETL